MTSAQRLPIIKEKSQSPCAVCLGVFNDFVKTFGSKLGGRQIVFSPYPAWNPTNLYGPRPIGCRLKPSSPTCSTYFLGTIHDAPVAGVP